MTAPVLPGRDHVARFLDHSWEDKLLDSPPDYVAQVRERLFTLAPYHDVNECWPWLGRVRADGYGSMSVNGRHRLAHRVMYVMWVGLPPDGHVLDHLCERRDCVNLVHLDPVLPAENTRRALRNIRAAGFARRRARCASGHPFTKANTRWGSDGARRCLTCERIRENVRRARLREEIAAHGLPEHVPHGMPGYRVGCRCEACRAANTAATRARREGRSHQGVLLDIRGRIVTPNAGQFGETT